MSNTVPHPCRCLLREAGQEEISKTIGELISMMPEEDKAAEPIRQKRLAICISCEHLLNGTCALCGCYVEARAAVRTQYCPDVPARWSTDDTVSGSAAG